MDAFYNIIIIGGIDDYYSTNIRATLTRHLVLPPLKTLWLPRSGFITRFTGFVTRFHSFLPPPRNTSDLSHPAVMLNLPKGQLLTSVVAFAIFVVFLLLLQYSSNYTRMSQQSDGSPVAIVVLDNDAAPGQVHVDSSRESCKYWTSEIRRRLARRRAYCEPAFKALWACYRPPEYGQKPLKNFYITRSFNDPDRSAAYLNASLGLIHLPKTGGTSVEKIMIKSFGKTNPLRRYSSDGQRKCIFMHQTVEQQNKDLPHMWYSKRTYGLHNFLYANRRYLYVTWFREPIARFISSFHYQFLIRSWYHELNKKYIYPTHDNLTEFLVRSKGVQITDMNDYYVRLLMFGEYPEVDANYEDCCGSYDLRMEFPVPTMTEEHYKLAKKNLEETVGFIGIMEDFQASQDMFCDMLKIPRIENPVHVNANPHKKVDELTPFEMQEMLNRTYWDRKLYEDAKKIYEIQKQVYTNEWLPKFNSA